MPHKLNIFKSSRDRTRGIKYVMRDHYRRFRIDNEIVALIGDAHHQSRFSPAALMTAWWLNTTPAFGREKRANTRLVIKAIITIPHITSPVPRISA